jgi:hypothetical protein
VHSCHPPSRPSACRVDGCPPRTPDLSPRPSLALPLLATVDEHRTAGKNFRLRRDTTRCRREIYRAPRVMENGRARLRSVGAPWGRRTSDAGAVHASKGIRGRSCVRRPAQLGRKTEIPRRTFRSTVHPARKNWVADGACREGRGAARGAVRLTPRCFKVPRAPSGTGLNSRATARHDPRSDHGKTRGKVEPHEDPSGATVRTETTGRRHASWHCTRAVGARTTLVVRRGRRRTGIGPSP